MKNRKRNFWGWGYADYELDMASVSQFKALLKMALDIEEFSDLREPVLEELNLRAPRITLPRDLSIFCTAEDFDRASHSYGKSYRDVWRGLHGIYDNPPDYVAYPTNEEQIMSLMDYAGEYGVSLIPFGGGSSVVGGVEPTTDNRYSAVISVDMKHFNKILEVDIESRSARIQAGIFGPALDRGLKEYGLTMRHFPQSFEFSTLGGWIATRSGGHYATLFTHIDEFVQSIRMVTPQGIMQSRRLPGSGAGPSEERLVTGSEGVFGIITEAWVRLQHIPTYKMAQTINFKEWANAVETCRALAQSGLNPANARLIDRVEALSNGLGDGQHDVVILGFESHNHDVKPLMKEGLDICSRLGGTYVVKEKSDRRDQAADRWKKSFLQAPYLRDEFVRLGCIMETFETAVTWDQFEAFHNGIITAANEAIDRICGGGMITCRFTHLYPDGPAPYYTIMAKGQTGREIEQWNEIKQIVSNKIIELGGTITHHHAVGKDHQPYYEKQRSEVFAASLSAVKDRLDPAWIMNPDVLIKRS
jgi:alkyldihydroxyacetonephosphate synthase